jgi:hypothetical protein
MSAITKDEMRLAAERVFVTHESTLEQEAAGQDIASLKQTVLVIRRVFKSAAAGVPASAYESQSAGPAGENVWSAGEIASHIAGTMIWTDTNIRAILGLDTAKPNPDVAVYADIRQRSREESLAALEAADSELARILELIPDDADSGRTIEHERFGTIGVKGWLLLTALHEGDHANQVRRLGDQAS